MDGESDSRVLWYGSLALYLPTSVTPHTGHSFMIIRVGEQHQFRANAYSRLGALTSVTSYHPPIQILQSTSWAS